MGEESGMSEMEEERRGERYVAVEQTSPVSMEQYMVSLAHLGQQAEVTSVNE